MKIIPDWIVRLWYKIPSVKYTGLPFVVNRPDDRAFGWYKSRQRWGFDERTLWDFGTHLENRIKRYFTDFGSPLGTLEYGDFRTWFDNDHDGVKKTYDMVRAYREWGCPVFLRPALQDDRVYRKMLDKMLEILKDRAHGISVEEHTMYLFDNVFYLGW
jgi:hypothetical protein